MKKITVISFALVFFGCFGLFGQEVFGQDKGIKPVDRQQNHRLDLLEARRRASRGKGVVRPVINTRDHRFDKLNEQINGNGKDKAGLVGIVDDLDKRVSDVDKAREEGDKKLNEKIDKQGTEIQSVIDNQFWWYFWLILLIIVALIAAIIALVRTFHNHDGQYAGISHHHDGRYSLNDHNHDGCYSQLDHRHDELYAGLNHDHTGVYARLDRRIAPPVALQPFKTGLLAPKERVNLNEIDLGSVGIVVTPPPAITLETKLAIKEQRS